MKPVREDSGSALKAGTFLSIFIRHTARKDVSTNGPGKKCSVITSKISMGHLKRGTRSTW